MTIRVLLAEDQAPVRLAFRIILDAQPDIAVVAEAAARRSTWPGARARTSSSRTSGCRTWTGWS